MTDKDLYSTIMGIRSPWQVTDVALSVEDATVTVKLDYDASKAGSAFVCPTCGKSASVYDRREPRTWRHLDSMQFQTYLVASLPRVSCPTHGILTASVSWAEPNSRFTLLFEAFAIRVLQATGVQSRAASLLRLNPGQVHDLMERAVVRGLARREQQTQFLEHLSVDEKSHQKGHRYISVLSDPLGKRVLDVVEGRTHTRQAVVSQEAVETLFLSTIDEAQRPEVRSVSMDMSQVCDSMWPAFMNARETVFPHAQTVHHRFHIASYLGEAVDKTRRGEHRSLTSQDDPTLNKTKYLWLRSGENLTEKQKAAMDVLTNLDLETSKVWAFKESFREFFNCRTVIDAAHFFDNWYEGALALENIHLTRVANMLSNHFEGLLAYIECRVTNAAAEGLNALIQQVKATPRASENGRAFESLSCSTWANSTCNHTKAHRAVPVEVHVIDDWAELIACDAKSAIAILPLE